MFSSYRNTRAVVLSVLLCVLSVMGCHAASGKKKLRLLAKNPATWAIVKGGPGGEMIYHEVTGVYSLAAAGLQPRSSYALVRVDEGVPKAEILSRGMSNGQGRLELNGSWRNWTRKFWVVSGDDVVGKTGENGSLKAWHPERYLFEEKPLGIACACPEPEEP
jgi:hypothetical protein